MPYTINTKVNGTSFRNGGTGLTPTQWAALQPGVALDLKHDPAGAVTGEKHPDPNAIAVYLGADLIGYVPRDTATKIMTEFRDAWDAGRRAEVTEITGGYGHKSNKGVNIRLYFLKVPEAIAMTAGGTDPAGQDSWEAMDPADPVSSGQE